MSTDGARASTHNSTNGTRASTPTHNGKQQSARHEVAAFFNAVAAAGEQPRLRSVTGTCQFTIAGAGTWRIALTRGVPTVTEGTQHTRHPDCIVTCEASDFLRIVKRQENLNLYAAILQGLVTITGDLAFAFAVLGSSTIRGAGLDTALPR